MMNDEEFKKEVYDRFEKYKAKKAEQRKNILKYGSLTLSALIVAVAVASTIIRNSFTAGKSAPTMEDRESSFYNVDINKGENKSAGGEHVNINEVDENNDKPTTAAEEGTQNATASPTQAVTTAAATVSPTQAVTTAAATVSPTQAATTAAATTRAATETGTPTETNEKFDPSPDITVIASDDVRGYLFGVKTFSDTGEAVAAEEAESARGSGVKRYKFETDDYESDTPRKCFAVINNGALIIDSIDDDGKTLTFSVSLHEFAPDPLRYINIFTVAGDRKIVFKFSELPTSQGGN